MKQMLFLYSLWANVAYIYKQKTSGYFLLLKDKQTDKTWMQPSKRKGV